MMNWEGSGMQHLWHTIPGTTWTKENHKILRIADAPAITQTGHLQNKVYSINTTPDCFVQC